MLPVLNVAKTQIEIPFLNKKYTIRPYLVGEEKGLLMALESRDDDNIANAIKNLITSCVFEKINVDDLSAFETEYIFLQLRKISVNNVVEIGLRHQHEGPCEHVQKVQIDIDSVKHTGKVDNKIVLDEEAMVGVIMQIPTNKILAKKYNSETEKVFGMIQDCIVSIFDAENIYHTKEVSADELKEWVNNLNNAQMRLIADFFTDLPSFYYDVEYTCEKCGQVEKLKIEGLTNFL